MTTRDRILDGAAEVMRTRGLAHTTTKEIARAAGYSEATLYKTFVDKVDLFLCVLAERLPPIDLLRDGLADGAAACPVDANLRQVGEQALAFYAESFPIAASVFADADLLARHREGVLARGAGPARINEVLTAYLEAERVAGRIAATSEPAAAASALVGGCFQRAFLLAFAGEVESEAQRRRFVADLVATLWPALCP